MWGSRGRREGAGRGPEEMRRDRLFLTGEAQNLIKNAYVLNNVRNPSFSHPQQWCSCLKIWVKMSSCNRMLQGVIGPNAETSFCYVTRSHNLHGIWFSCRRKSCPP